MLRRFKSASDSCIVNEIHTGSAASEATVSMEVIRVELRELHEQERCQDIVELSGFPIGSTEVVKKKLTRDCLALDVGEDQGSTELQPK